MLYVSFCIGNILLSIFRELGGLFGAPAETLSEIMIMIKHFSRQLGQEALPVNLLTLQMFRYAGKAPRFKGKASETRRMLPCLLLFLEHLPTLTPCSLIRLNCVKHLNGVYEELYNWGPGSGERAAVHARKHCILYVQLGRLAEVQTPCDKLFNVYLKHHLFVHCIESIPATGNPMSSWCYADEREIACTVALAESVHVNSMPLALMQKYRCSALVDV